MPKEDQVKKQELVKRLDNLVSRLKEKMIEEKMTEENVSQSKISYSN